MRWRRPDEWPAALRETTNPIRMVDRAEHEHELPRSKPSISSPLVVILASGTAVSVGTLYLNQPILPLLSHALVVSQASVGWLVTVTQVGYAAGLVLLVPIGDVFNKKKLIAIKLILLVLALISAGAAPGLGALMTAHAAIGLFSTAAQDFVPLAAELATPERRGRVVGSVMSGLLLGILASRIFSGTVADKLGWRAVFFGAAGLVALVGMVVQATAPSRASESRAKYLDLLRSTLALLRQYRVLKWAVLTQGMLGLAFSAFWTVLAFHLAGPPFEMRASQIGSWGLAGAAGALAAPLAGRRADRRGPLGNVPIAIAIVTAGFALMTAFAHSILALVIGVIAFDFGVQMSVVSHQALIYALDESARSRLNAVFVSGMFVHLALGSFLGNAVFARFGWTGAMILCLVSCAGAAAMHLRLRRAHRAARRSP